MESFHSHVIGTIRAIREADADFPIPRNQKSRQSFPKSFRKTPFGRTNTVNPFPEAAPDHRRC